MEKFDYLVKDTEMYWVNKEIYVQDKEKENTIIKPSSIGAKRPVRLAKDAGKNIGEQIDSIGFREYMALLRKQFGDKTFEKVVFPVIAKAVAGGAEIEEIKSANRKLVLQQNKGPEL